MQQKDWQTLLDGRLMHIRKRSSFDAYELAIWTGIRSEINVNMTSFSVRVREEELAPANVNGVRVMVDWHLARCAIGLPAMLIVVMVIAMIMCPMPYMDMGPSSMFTLRE